MNAWYLICFLSAIAIFIAFANQYILKMQTTIAITTGSVVISLLLILAVKLQGDSTALEITQVVSSINFNQLLLKGMLGFLLFAGALEINLAALKKQRWEITALVLFSTLASTFIIGYLSFYAFELLGWPVPFIYCLLFGALISPTDPIAVLAIIKQMRAPEGISVQVEGESLFNDGIGLVIFTTIFAVAFYGTEATVVDVGELFLVDAIGGIAFGLVIALVGHFLIINSRDVNIRLLLTLTIPTAGFAAANIWEISGALAMVTSGILLGNITRSKATERTGPEDTRYVKDFWHATDSFLNALLFLIIGMLIVTMPISLAEIGLGLLMVPMVLFARFISVGAPFIFFKKFRHYDKHTVKILTWGGLRGGLALAMAAAIPRDEVFIGQSDLHNLIVIITYVVVIFSIIVQGLTISPLIQSSISANKEK
ncbi:MULTISPECIES: sodium:proton antiporter [unclassified Pseudoalteromonas]|uniref:cation:proton antiporter n=1 Tax=unclassified Pseudoalteromonas TaxID=194690 RepID=UPI000B3CE368|nr:MULTISPECIES: sodium:proton antiporter [unclassified Pseudoalteromonas]MDN3380256.1 sodium:proton antiporter [Pseudoalteromonas sp. APC 3893]MDN3388646.1 sodium:proton antiporter [Pseudoalteromonas sp. APC 4017]OUS73500.1 sodium:proton antiporter [Pseudoalteromonas sp. A601]